MDSCVYSEVTRSCQQVGCARNRLQIHTVQQKLKLFLSIQVYAWMEFPLLIFGIWLKKCFILHQTNSTTPKIRSHRETCRGTLHMKKTKSNQARLSGSECEETRRVTPHQTSTPKTEPRFQPSTTILTMLYNSEDNEAVIKKVIKGRSPTMRHVSRTHRVAIQIKYVDTKHQLADIDKREFHT